MIFEFILVYRRPDQFEILPVIRDCLGKVLQDNLIEFDVEAIERMVLPRIERPGNELAGDDGEVHQRALFGFAIDLPEETTSLRIIVDEFTEALGETTPVTHLVKFEDPLLREDLARWAEEISALEMKLRRVLTLIYLNAYQDGDPYELLREESVQPMNKERPDPKHMRDRAENPFFHLTFSQYISLNRKPELKLPSLLELVRNKEAYETFRAELGRTPVQDEDDAVLLAGLKERMDAIEAMRNCCAHNRRPSNKVEENYLNARPLLDQLLDGYLARWEYQEPVEEMTWERKAREAVEHAIAHAHWDEDERTITLFNADDDRIRKTVSNREDLEKYLCDVATTEFYANAPREDGEFLYECDHDGIVWAALEDYEDRLAEFFQDGKST